MWNNAVNKKLWIYSILKASIWPWKLQSDFTVSDFWQNCGLTSKLWSDFKIMVWLQKYGPTLENMVQSRTPQRKTKGSIQQIQYQNNTFAWGTKTAFCDKTEVFLRNATSVLNTSIVAAKKWADRVSQKSLERLHRHCLWHCWMEWDPPENRWFHNSFWETLLIAIDYSVNSYIC